MNTWTQRALGVVILVAVCVLAAAGIAYRMLWQRYDQGLQQFESRSERIDGVIRAGDAINTQLAAAQGAVAPRLHPKTPNAENDIQQKLRDLVVASGATLVSSQTALEGAASNQKIVAYKLTATVSGEWVKLVRLMETLQTQTPPFWVRTVSLSREGVPTGPQNARLTVQLDAPVQAGGNP